MPLIVWFTTSTAALPSVQEASRLVEAQLLVTSQFDDLHDQAIDLVLWSPDSLDKSIYERLWAICARIMICVERGVIIPRWYPRYSPYGPLY